MARIYLKLAFAGIRARRLQAALTVLVVGAAALALMLAVNVGRVADAPFERTFDATKGAHVWIQGLPGVDIAAAQRLPGVRETTGVLPVAIAGFVRDGKRYGIRVTGVDSRRPRVSRPLLVEGRWPTRGELLLEQSFGTFLGLHAGDRLVVHGTSLVVSGLAIVAQGEAYPKSQPGQALALRETVLAIAPRPARIAHVVGVRLTDPAGAPAFAAVARRTVGGAFASTWLEEREDARVYTATAKLPLEIFSVMLLVAGGLVLGTLIGGRVVAQVRELGLLKAAGLTPAQVARVFVVEQVALGAVGVAAGLVAATMATPAFVTKSAALLNASETPSFDPLRALAVASAVLVAVAAFAFVPSLRAGRRTTAAVLGGSASRPSGRVRPSRLPLTVALGLRHAFTHRARAILAILALALSVTTVVMSLAMERSLDVATVPPPAPAMGPGVDAPQWDPVDDDAGEGDRLRPVVYAFDGVLIFIGAVNLLAAMLLGLRERVRDLGLLKAVGLTPRELARSFVAGQAAYGVLAAVAGIPLGLAVMKLVFVITDSDEYAYPSWWSLALLVPSTMLVVAALAAPLAHRAASLRVVDALRYE